MSFWDTALTVAFPVPYLANKFAAKVIAKPKTTTQPAVTQGQTSNYITASDPNTAQTAVNINSDRGTIFLIGGLALAGVLVAVLLSPKSQTSAAPPRPPE